MSRFLASILVSFLIAPPALSAATYYVSPDGDDADPGTKEKPWRTIQKAADAIMPGDTCFIHEGVYRETVAAKRSGEPGKPIRFLAVPGDVVQINGADLVDGRWTKHKGSIYKTKWPRPARQLFVDGKAMIEARWPNATPETLLGHAAWAHSAKGSRYGKLIDPKLAAAGVDAAGAIAVLNVAHQFFSWTRTVDQHAPGSDTFTYAKDLGGITHHADKTRPWEDDRYFLFGKLSLLDAPGEWFHDAAAGMLYLWPPGGKDPSSRRVEAKSRDWGFTADRCDHVVLGGLHLFGCALSLENCSDCVVEDCHMLYLSHPRRLSEPGHAEDQVVGRVAGDRNTVRGCSFAYGPIGGLKITGRANLVENNLIHDFCTYGCLRHVGLAVNGRDSDTQPPNVVRHNTMFRFGNAVINYRGPGIVVEYNHVFDGGMACKDVALVYTGQPSTAGNIVRYNWVHGCYTDHLHGGWLRGGLGIRGDDQTRELTVHHNVVWDCGRDGIIVKGDRNRVFNNTVLRIGTDDVPGNYVNLHTMAEPKKPWRRQHPLMPVQNEHSLIANNASLNITGDNRGRPYRPEKNLVTNFPPPGESLAPPAYRKRLALVDPGRLDFRPKKDSPLVDAGTKVAGFDGAIHGRAPDIGAYEYGGRHWVPGHRGAVRVFRRGGNLKIALAMPPLKPIEVTAAGRRLTFTPENWMRPQTLKIPPGQKRLNIAVERFGASEQLEIEQIDPRSGTAVRFQTIPRASD